MEDFWHSLLPHNPSNESFENRSIDVALKGCFDNYDKTACVRNSVLAFLGFSSFCLCAYRIAKLHVFHHPQIHQYLIFYFASFEILFLIVKWIAFTSLYQLEFAASYLKMIQFILLCHFNWSWVSRILHQQRLINWIIIPVLFLFLSFYSFIIALGMLSHFSAWEECLAPHWLLLSFAEFLGIQLYVVAGIYITKKINSMSTMDQMRWEQKRDIWSVTATYELSSVVTLAYYATLRGLGNHEIGCSGIFGHIQKVYSPVYATLMIMKYMLPIWVMFFIFYPTRGGMSSEEEQLLGLSTDGSTKSVFSREPRLIEYYRQLVLPVLYFGRPRFRRSFSSPAIFVSPQCSPTTQENPNLLPAHVPYYGYGAMDSCHSQPEAAVFQPSRSRHDSGLPGKTTRGRKVPVSLNQCSGEMESVTPSPNERA